MTMQPTTKKIALTGAVGAFVILMFYVLGLFGVQDPPSEVVASVTTVFNVVVAWFTRNSDTMSLTGELKKS